MKIEVDPDPPAGATTQAVSLFSPIPFTVKSFDLASLFAGKLAATLYRPYKFNTKGRDWYDFLWYISRGTKLNAAHFQARIAQIGKWSGNSPVTIVDVKRLMRERVAVLNNAGAKADVLPFVKDQHSVEQWTKDKGQRTKDMFLAAVDRIC